uniref:Uncharacterized protein n=1 Tax=uncultured prokaryote TaxID=198431 RepID=A0A0H5Q434_9ZZZZ|nr:hypothetical protein [uncultured prokaryote]
MPPAHKRVNFYGTLLQTTGGGSEIFEFGYADSSALTNQALSAALLPVMQTAWTASTNAVSEYARLDGCRVESIDATGKVTSSYATTGTRPVGGSVAATVTILSHAITLETATPNDHGGMVRGRFYPPAYVSVEGATSLLTTIQTYANAWRGIVAGLVTAGSIPVVASVTSGGQLAPVTAVSVDTVIDTIRRRKNHVTSQRSTAVAL